METRPPAWLRLRPDPAPVSLHDSLADRQAAPRARVLLLGVQPLEDHEDPPRVARVEPDPVIADREHPLLALASGGEVDVGRALAPELDRVADQVLEELADLGAVAPHGGEGVV